MNFVENFLSTAFDHKLMDVQQYILHEVLSEFSAYYLLLLTAVVSLTESHRIAAKIHHLPHPE